MAVTPVAESAVQYMRDGGASAASAVGATGFAETLESVSQERIPHVFKGAPDFVVEWANKYSVHISNTAVPIGQNGPYTVPAEGEPMLPTVHIHPKALERMQNDPAFAREMEQEIARLSGGMHKMIEEGVSDGELAGVSITIHEDGSISRGVFLKGEERKDTWAITEVLMKRVDALCEEMHEANEEKVKRQLEGIQKSRAMSEFRRISSEVTSESAATEQGDIPADGRGVSQSSYG